tara:strand:+ start:1367 stop:1756 length:390 start_codon:yes stop_codon:yes gene_type:complete
MKNFVIYNSEGTILRTGSCPDEVFDLQRKDNELIMEGVANDATQRIVDGAIVDKPEFSNSEKNSLALSELRNIRDIALLNSDWTQVADSPLTDSKKAEWATYRQSLRDLPANNANVTNIDDVIFPTVPT